MLTQDEEEELLSTQFDGVIMTGLKSEGVRWNKEVGHLDEPIYGNVLEAMPAIWFRPTTTLPKEGKYAMPLYTTVNRFGVLSTTGLSTNYVMNMHLPTERPESWWILRGAAAFI